MNNVADIKQHKKWGGRGGYSDEFCLHHPISEGCTILREADIIV